MRFESPEHAVSVVFNGVVYSAWRDDISEVEAGKVRAICPKHKQEVRRRRCGRYFCGLCNDLIESFEVAMPRPAAGVATRSAASKKDSLLDAFTVGDIYRLIERQPLLFQSHLLNLYANKVPHHDYHKQVLVSCIAAHLAQAGLKAPPGMVDAEKLVHMLRFMVELSREQACNQRKLDKRSVAKELNLEENLFKPARPWGKRFELTRNYLGRIEADALAPVYDYMVVNRLFDTSAA